MYNPMDLSNRTIVVAGASSGIGKETAIVLSQLGAKLVLIARRENLLAETVASLQGEGHRCFPFDLSETSEIERLVKEIIDAVGAIDGLVYAAGVSMNAPLSQVKPVKLEKLYKTNFYAFIEIARQFTRKKNYNPGMSIVGISSTASLMGDKGKIMYASSKAAMNSAVRVMAHELGDRGIRVNAVAPGMTATEMYNAFLTRLGEGSDTKQQLEERQYLGIVTPRAVANAISFLISPGSEYITGVTLPVDAGMLSC